MKQQGLLACIRQRRDEDTKLRRKEEVLRLLPSNFLGGREEKCGSSPADDIKYVVNLT